MTPTSMGAATSGLGGLFGDHFTTAAMDDVFNDLGLVQSWLDAEAGLARAQASLGIVPSWAAERITERADTNSLDLAQIRSGMAEADHPLVPTIWEFARLCGEAGDYVHWGATTQDIMDTGLALQLRKALKIVAEVGDTLSEWLAGAAEEYAATVMIGRTHGQHALPITFGLKLAGWLDELTRHLERLRLAGERALVVELGGAAGTLASLGNDDIDIVGAYAAELSLGRPDIAWHAARDNVTDVCLQAAMLAGWAGRICNEIIQLQRTEIGELEEAQPTGKVGSSTMPHKRNPMTAETALAASRIARSIASLSLETLTGEHERDMSTWAAEWWYVPQACHLLDATLRQTLEVLEGLTVDSARMSANIELTGGLVMTEALMMHLAPSLGRQRAHDIMHELSQRCVATGDRLVDVLASDQRLADTLADPGALAAMLDPASYLGITQRCINDVVLRHRTRSNPEPENPS